MTSTPTLHAQLGNELQDLFYAESHLLRALPRFAKAATNPALKAGLTAHLAQTRLHVTRLTRALRLLGLPVKGKVCHAMLGLIEEGAGAIGLIGPAAVRDAALIGAVQRIEHYEMAGYGTAHTFARAVGENRVADLLQRTLDEEGSANKRLTVISRTVNAEALTAGEQLPAATKTGLPSR